MFYSEVFNIPLHRQILGQIIRMVKNVNIAIFASGGGSNAQKIIEHFAQSTQVEIALIVSDKRKAGVIEKAETAGIPWYVHSQDEMEDGTLLTVLEEYKIDFIVLAGYLKKIGQDLIDAFPNAIVNIHPALLPKYGGKGMYGMNVHEAVVAAGEIESGPTIHFVNEHYDEGTIIAQFKCPVYKNDNAEAVQKRVLALEHKHYPKVIESIIQKL